MAEYPARWESDAVLSDGGTVHVRPITPADEERLLALYHRLSDETIYLRFFSPMPAPSAAMLERLTHVDYLDRMALVAELDDEFVAVARYDRLPDDSAAAEVAFTVQDEHQGRGLGTLLLEHLAVVARAHGITRFVADTLPNNRKMLRVFAHAGYEVERHFADGTIRVTFSIEPTPESLAAVEHRERVSEAASVARLLAPSSIAVIGASRQSGTIGHELFRNLLRYGFQGPVFPVNPASTHVAGVRAYSTVAEIPDPVDLAIVVAPAAAVPDIVEQCGASDVHGLVIVSAGFAEAGAEGLAAERALVARARAHGMRIIGPNCLGVVNTDPAVRMNATFAPLEPVSGRVAFLSQSGGLGIELMSRASELGLGISSFVSVGNKADVSGNDLLQHWEDDAGTDVILLYLESFGNPRKFARLARRIARRKPIVAVKSGRTRAGRRAASSHTAALATPDVAVDALFRQAGVVRVDTLEQLLQTAQVLAHQPLPAGRRVAIVGNSGGPGILAADTCAGNGLAVPELDAATQEQLRGVLATGAAVRNPVDLVAGATADDYEEALGIVLADPGIDALLAIFVPPHVTSADAVARAIATAAAGQDKTVVACFLGRRGMPEALRAGDERRAIPSYAFPEEAAQALGRAADLADWRRRPEGTVSALEGIDLDTARAIVTAPLAGTADGEELGGAGGEELGGVWLDTADATRLCACFGIGCVDARRVASADAAVSAAVALGGPVALKAFAPGLVHKTEAGGVALDLDTPDAVAAAYAEMQHRIPGLTGADVQRMVPPGIEVIVGVTHDPSFGPLVLFGLGGTTAELLADRALRIVPLTDVDATELVRSLRGSPLFFGYRGRPNVDVTALEDLLLRVGHLADELPEVAEMDLNPVIVSESGMVVVDARVRVAPAQQPAPTDWRRLRS